ncbi:ATP-grasp domain-containing protein [Erwinia papayae]|uniref:ATP-grasp domain-containing protein n=1 Tax=Erwinia papayae TaxID=206499 RepID=A0ABV3N1U9_9GAMM
MKKNLLVLYVHSASRLSHLRKINSLKDKYNVTILYAKVEAKNYIERFAHQAYSVTIENSAENLDTILSALGPTFQPDGILNVSEPFLPLQQKLCAHFNLPGPSLKAVEVGRNKYNMRAFSRELGIPVPDFVQVTSENIADAARLTFPVIAKPLIGSGSSLVRRYDDYPSLVSDFAQLSDDAVSLISRDSQFKETFSGEYPFIVEEIIGGEVLFATRLPYRVGEISVESVYFNGEVEVLAIHDKPLPNNGPHFEEVCFSTPTRIPQALQQQAKAYVSAIHRALGAGAYVLHTEFRTLANEIKLIEFGVRMGGSAIYNSLLASTGIDFIEVQIAIAMREEVNIPRKTARPVITCLVFPQKQGRITAIHGENLFVSDPHYVEHQIYDNIGDIAYRAPLATRSTLHVLFQAEDFSALEETVNRFSALIRIDTVEN